MNPGRVLLDLALITALASAALHVGALRGRRWRAAAWVYVAHALLLVAAFTLLSAYFLGHRFEFSYVAQYSSRALSPGLTLAAVWAGQEGSILLWAAIGALLGLALLRQPGALSRPAMFFVSLVQICLLALLRVRSPFVMSSIAPADGQGLNPLLEDPWMVIHPPVLFLGYAALVIPFALAAAALVRGQYREWNRMTWPWALFGVVTLGAGIALGGVWAYKVLGWGGYWGWDPVENASLVPWLVVVALLHGLLIQRTTGALIRTNLVLAFAGWATVLGGTYLTRSGVLQDFSVHSFADSGLNAPLQLTLALFTLLGAGLLLARWRTIDHGAATITSVSRESALWLGMLTVLALAGLVTVGTSAPLITSLMGKPAGLQPSFYSSVTLPIGIALVLLMGLSPALRWFRQSGLSWLSGVWPGVAGAVLVTGSAMLAGARDPGYLTLIAVTGLAIGVNVAVAVKHFRRGWMYGAGYLGHAGVAVMALGIALSSTLGKTQRLELPRGHQVQSLGYSLTYRGESASPRGGRLLDILVQAPGWTLNARPELIPSPRDQGMVRKPAISGTRELYLSPLETREGGAGAEEVVWLEKNRPTDVEGARFTFVGFRLESAEHFQVFADLDVEAGGKTHRISPAMAAGAGGSRPTPVEAPTVGPVSIARIDADHARVALLLPPRAAGSAIVDLSTKPFINLVWVGALLALLGTSLAGLRRATEKLPARADRSTPSGRRSPTRGGATSTQEEEHSMLPATSKVRAHHTGAALRLLIAVLGLLLSLAPMARAAERAAAAADTTKPVMFLREMLVTGSRYPRAYYESPQALSFVTRNQLREAAPLVASDVFTQIPGVDNSKDSPWEQRPVIRGLSGQRVLVLMDGSPMNSARGNGPHPSLVDPSQIDRIEVVRGPSSVAYGSDALGGAINIITRQSPRATGGRSLRGGLRLGGSSAEKARSVVGELSPQIGRFSAFLSGGGQKIEDYDSPDGTVKNSAFSDYNWLANLRYDLTDRLALKTGWQQYRANGAGIPGLTTNLPGYHQEFQFPFYNRDYAHVTLDHNYPGSFWLNQAQVQVYWQREFRDFWSTEDIDRSQFPTFGIFGAPASAQTRVTNQDRYFDLGTWGFKTQMTSAKTEHVRFTVGVDAARDQTDGDNVRFRWYDDASGARVSNPTLLRTASVPDGKFDNYAGFVQGEWYPSRKATLSAGARLTHYRYRTDAGINQSGSPFTPRSVDDNALSGSIGATYEAWKDVHLTANIANGYREPNAQDLFFSGPASVGFVFGNENLKPERSVSYDAGLRWGPGPFAISGNLFYSTFNDLIQALPLSAPPPLPPFVPPGQGAYKYTNVATATVWGGDLEGEARVLERWTARTQLSGQVGDITSRDAILKVYGINSDRVPLELVPPFRGSTSLRWTHPGDRFWVESSARYSWRTNRLPPPTPGVGQLTSFKKEWIVGDLFAGARLGSQRVLVGVRNFTDRAYRQPLGSLEEPGISLVGSISTDF
jgi:cytochrome c-type biogenesis protein CcmF